MSPCSLESLHEYRPVSGPSFGAWQDSSHQWGAMGTPIKGLNIGCVPHLDGRQLDLSGHIGRDYGHVNDFLGGRACRLP